MVKSKRVTAGLGIILLLVLVGLAVFIFKPPFLMPQGKYEVIPAYEGQARYIAAARADSSADKAALYKKFVTDVYQGTCGGDGLVNTNPMNPVVARYPLGTLDELEQGVQALQKSDIVPAVQAALQKASAKLPGAKITVCLFVLDPSQQSWVSLFMNGVYGGTYSPTQVNIEIAPKGDWQTWLPYTVTHEYQHTIWMQDLCGEKCWPEDAVQNDLLSFIIAEGWADSFAHAIYPSQEPPWTKALSAEQEAAQWQGMQPDLTGTSPDLGRYIFGDAQIPQWTGYTIGYHIVQNYLKVHPDASPATWTKLDPHELLKESGYSGKP